MTTAWLLIGWLVLPTLGFFAGAWTMDAKRRDEAVDVAAGWSDEAYRRADVEDKLDVANAALAEAWRLYEADRIHLPGDERERFLELMGKAGADRPVRS